MADMPGGDKETLGRCQSEFSHLVVGKQRRDTPRIFDPSWRRRHDATPAYTAGWPDRARVVTVNEMPDMPGGNKESLGRCQSEFSHLVVGKQRRDTPRIFDPSWRRRHDDNHGYTAG